MVELFANSRDPDQTPRSAASDLGSHSLSVTRLGVSSLQWVNRLLVIKESGFPMSNVVWFVPIAIKQILKGMTIENNEHTKLNTAKYQFLGQTS